MLADNLERETRKRNITITKIPESRSTDRKVRDAHDRSAVIAILKTVDDRIDDRDIINVTRAGPSPTNSTNAPSDWRSQRIMIVKLRTPDLAEFLHDYGSGYPVGLKKGGNAAHWINEDLIPVSYTPLTLPTKA